MKRLARRLCPLFAPLIAALVAMLVTSAAPAAVATVADTVQSLAVHAYNVPILNASGHSAPNAGLICPRQDTYLMGPLRDAIGRGDITLRFIP